MAEDTTGTGSGAANFAQDAANRMRDAGEKARDAFSERVVEPAKRAGEVQRHAAARDVGHDAIERRRMRIRSADAGVKPRRQPSEGGGHQL